MSYDLIFVRLAPDQSWAEFLAAEHDFDGEGARRAVATETWQRIVRRVRQILPEAVDTGGELDDERTAIQVFCGADEASVQVPYWHTGAAARRVLTAMYEIAAILEQETGLRGYDPQLEAPTAELADRVEDAVAVFDGVAASFASRGIQTGPSL